MDNTIVVDLDHAVNAWKRFQDHYSTSENGGNVSEVGSRNQMFSFNTDLSVVENLNNLSFFALHHTLPVLYSYNNIFLELVARWVENTDMFEVEYQRIHKKSNVVRGGVILCSLTKLVRVTECMNFIEFYLDTTPIFDNLHNVVIEKRIAPSELESILLAYYRLVPYQRFKKFIQPAVLYEILTLGSEYNVAKYLAVLVLSIYLESSESVLNKMIQHHTEEDLVSEYEGSEIDYKFLNIIEAKRLAKYHSLEPIAKTKSEQIIIIDPTHLSGYVTSVYGILVPNFTQNSAMADMVPSEKSVKVLRQLAVNIQHNYPTLLYGSAGSGKTFLFNQLAKIMANDSVIKIHLGEQTDAKLLLGTYVSGDKPGTFKWRSGVLTTAVKEGKWVLIEDIDKAPTEVLSILLTLLEKRELIIPSRGEVIKAHNNFQIVSTIRVVDTIPDLIGLRLWKLVQVEVPTQTELVQILAVKFPLLSAMIKKFLLCYEGIVEVYSSNHFVALNRGNHPRIVSIRDLMKFCSRCNRILVSNGITSSNQLLESFIFDQFFQEAVDCFGSSLADFNALIPLTNIIGEHLEIAPSRINLFLNKHVPQFINEDNTLKIGRAILTKSDSIQKKTSNITSFARTNHSLRLMEQVSVAIQMIEPVLLVGETGTGKTTVVQQVAKMMNKHLTVINVSQQTESGDLLGGYKPVNTKIIAIPLQEVFENLFLTTFSQKKNEKFSQILTKVFNRGQWKNVIKLWREAVNMSKDLLVEEEPANDQQPKKKRKLEPLERKSLLDKWIELESKVKEFEIQASTLDNSFVFNFVEGSLVQAIRNGDWLLLDEINLASSDTLESIADLLADESRTLLLSEKGDIEPIKAHPDFRIFGCMNPSTDVGKRDLPLSIRTRFTEIYVHSPDRDINDLLAIIDKYIGRFAVSDEWVGQDIAELYLEAKDLSESNRIVDGANQKPHFSIRTLTRTLLYVIDIVSIYGLRRSLYEGFCMSFLTLLDLKSEALLKPVIEKYTIAKLKNQKSAMKQLPPCPSKNTQEYVQFKHYWMKHGPEISIPQPHYIITPFVEKNMLNLVRATAGRRFPVLIQGPTSAGKTSMIQYLANITGHKFVRINNHEHTDLQEYLGTYVSDSTGKLVFKEGVLVEAIRNGYWIVLDELNLAPTDILEALNRLLDDNRELFIPETQEVVHPHKDFMLFATQNPPGIYGGRKMLSRAFRNRFLELHFDDIPQDELEIILKERCQIAPSYGKRIVEVYKQLTIQRQSTRLFEQKNSFATLRDLFRWALRDAVGYEELAANGYMLLAERVRKPDEKLVVKHTIEQVMRVKLDMDSYYEKLEIKSMLDNDTIVWTKAMRRLAVLVATSMKHNEPLLLVGETGCGKTTVCQIIANFTGKNLITVNAHQNTETSDILGAQRPVRNRYETRSRLFNNLVTVLTSSGVDIPLEDAKLDHLLKQYEARDRSQDTNLEPRVLEAIELDKVNSKILFEWNDGPLVHAMKEGNFFLLDEISLADDSVLERLNSVLEPERTLLLAEKGTASSITADQSFQFLATMNPGGDYGKKELSPALRNRFTEIWVPSMDDFDDVRQIVNTKLKPQAQHLTEAIVGFSQYYGKRFGGATSGVISLRDILAWVQFINSSDLAPEISLLHGAAMVFIDALGTNNTAYLAENQESLTLEKNTCITELSQLVGEDLSVYYVAESTVELTPEFLIAGQFKIERLHSVTDDFLLHAPTTSANAMRVLRAMQVHKPILLEGSPGVGKTSLVSALAKATGHNLVRINLSEQTDLVDLFGSDSPAEGGATGEFVWRDAPFLRAMQRGEWVLLDEMNLASQSVLEGLNACLDHRGEAYIPELDKSFVCHPGFTVFAAQNPQYQGGGRKGLPKSFVNRFTVVYVDVLKKQDLLMISHHLYPNVDREVCDKMIEFMSSLETELSRKSWGTSGGPWEFNLRDTLRWLQIYNDKGLHKTPGDFFQMIVSHRFRTVEDKQKATDLFEAQFGKLPNRDILFQINEQFVQAGLAVQQRTEPIKYQNGSRSIPLQANYPYLEAAITCINHNLPLILTGPADSGKTELVRFLANCVGAELNEFAMNSDVDSMDILGGYEQVDLTRGITSLISQLKTILQNLILHNLQVNTDASILLRSLELYGTLGIRELQEVSAQLKALLGVYDNEELQKIAVDINTILGKMQQSESVKFEWFDGLLVQAVEKGSWLILDNANLCSPSVLDRLNSLLETNGSLIINECSSEDGQPRVLKPHKNFRLFLTVDPRYGELSRAMRNRGIELYMNELSSRMTDFDKNQTSVSYVSDVLSADRRFTEIDVIGKTETDSSTLTGTVPFNLIGELNRYISTINKSNQYSGTEKNILNQISTNISFLIETGMVKSLISVLDNYPATIGNTQALNPLINSYLVESSAESNYLFEVASGILTAQNQLDNVQQRAMNGSINELTYLERSAAVNLGRTIKKVPRLNVYGFMVAISEFINSVFVESQIQVFQKPVYEKLWTLQTIWNGLLQAGNIQDESRLRVYRDLVKNWCESWAENSDLDIAIASFSDSLHLTTGYLMEPIWHRFRGTYPNSKETWNQVIELTAVFEEFDTVAKAQELDSLDHISSFQSSLLELYDSVVKGDVGAQEFTAIINDMRSGIAKLRDLTQSFSIARNNEFQSEFHLLSVIRQLYEDQEKFSSLANRPTMEFTSKPYPNVFNSICGFDGVYRSGVSSIFDGTLSSMAISKSVTFGETSGKHLSMKLNDMKYFMRELVDNSPYILENPHKKFAEILASWIWNIISLVPGLVPELQELGPEERITLLEKACEGVEDPIAECFLKYFVPALKLTAGTIQSNELGVAYVLFACGAIQLYIPSSPFDPAIKEHVIYENFFRQQAMSESLIDSLTRTSDVLGGKKIIDVMAQTVPVPPSKPQVYRDGPIDTIFEEWKAFIDSSVHPAHIERLLNSAQDLNQASIQDLERTSTEFKIFQNNSSQFLNRMNRLHFFNDLNDILKGYVFAMKIGFDLISNSENLEVGSPLKLVDAPKLSTYSEVKSMFQSFTKFTKSQSPDSAICEQIMIYFMKLAFAHNTPDTEVLDQALQTVYYRWSLRKLKEAEEAQQSESWFKYSDPDTDIEGDFKILFPDYEEVLDIDITKVRTGVSFDSVYHQLAKSYITAFNGEGYTLGELIEEGSVLSEALNKASGASTGINNGASLIAALYKFTNTSNKFIEEQSIDFYRESSPKETQNAVSILHNIISFTNKLLEEWPEHATLRDIVRVCNEFLNYGLNTPIARQLQKIEQIYGFIADWEKYAHSKVSLKVYFDQLTTLIVSWRRLELSTWKELFVHEDKSFEIQIGKWWFHLFETIILSESENIGSLLAALNVFLSQTSFGEFRFRLDLLAAFKSHIYQIQGNSEIHNALANLIGFYEQFYPIISERIAKERKKLEKDINEVILLASWKDVNIDALKQSARKSHNSLYKIIRKYRSILALSVSTIIDQGLDSISTSAKSTSIPSVTAYIVEEDVSEICQTVSTWNERPNRLQNTTTVQKNMNVYLTRLDQESIPSIYYYAKSVVDQANKLRDETPTVYKDDTKKLIASLKTEKTKLLSDTLKELRRIGLKTTTRPEVKLVQGSSNQLLANDTFIGTLLDGSDNFLFRIIELLPRLKASLGSPTDDVPHADLERGFSVAENIIYHLVIGRKPLLALNHSITKLQNGLNKFEKIAYSSSGNLISISVKQSIETNLEVIRGIMEWIPKMIHFTVHSIEDFAKLAGPHVSTSRFFGIRTKLTQVVQTTYNNTNDSSIKFIRDFDEVLKFIRCEIDLWKLENPKYAFAGDMILNWLQLREINLFVNTSTSIESLRVVEDVETDLRDLSTAIIIAYQKITQLSDPFSEEDDNWFEISQRRLTQYVKSSYHSAVVSKLESAIETIQGIEYNQETSKTVSAMTQFTLPLVQNYMNLLGMIMNKFSTNYSETCRGGFILSTMLYSLSTKGFCSPEAPSEEKTDDNLQDGTGLGDGEGAQNNSKDVDQDDDLTEQAQTENNEKDDNKDEEENDDAVDMEGDMAGDLEEGSEQESDQEEDKDMDEEIDDIDDMDPNAIDEKMWDEEAKESNEKDGDVDGKEEDNMVGDNEEKETKEGDKTKDGEKDDKEGDEEGEEEEEEDGDEGDEKDVGEQEDDVKNDNEKVDEHLEETEALELPEDMNLDDMDDEEEGEDEKGDFDDMDVDEGEEEGDEEVKEGEEGEEEEGDDNEVEMEEGEEEEGEEEDGDEGDPEDGNPEEGEGGEGAPEEEVSEDEALGEENDQPEQNQETNGIEGVEGADDAKDEIDIESAIKQEAGEKGEGSDNQANEENQDLGGAGGASIQEDAEQTKDENKEKAKESIKELGDSLKEFHKRHQEIQASRDEEESKQKANENSNEFEHVDGTNTNEDTQALGAADKDQVQSIDEDKAIEDEEPIKEEPETGEAQMEVDEEAEDLEVPEVKNEPDSDVKGKTQGLINDRPQIKQEEGGLMKNELEDIDFEFEDDEIKISDLDLAPMSLDNARDQWRNSELATQELASGLCEQLRLILEPTLATKLRGDYKTGKRLNMKRIIPYIASEFRKDKIWLRRTKPSKRQYQIMIAVDDSKSMSESKSTELAFNSIALVSKALTQLESGGLSVVRFGEDVKVVHPFDKPFTQETGARIFQYFDFQQTKTDIKNLCNKSLGIFENAKINSSTDLWQLQIILSDGVCEDHETIQALVRRARDSKIMLVFVIIDGINSNESILDMSQVKYDLDVHGNSVLRVDKYLDSFPFEFYVVVKDINELPEMLSLILRQYFTEMAST